MNTGTFLQGLGAAIRERRQRLGLTQEQLADRAGLHRTYMGGIERGERNVAVKNLTLIAAALGMSLSQLVVEGEGFAEHSYGQKK
jgi:transcriptional regulator with XRE-family HTH domain